MKLSATMAEAICHTRDRGGKLIRFQGGYWSYPSVGRSRGAGAPDWYVGTATVEALVRRGELAYTEWRDGRNGRFPIVAEIPREAA